MVEVVAVVTVVLQALRDLDSRFLSLLEAPDLVRAVEATISPSIISTPHNLVISFAFICLDARNIFLVICGVFPVTFINRISCDGVTTQGVNVFSQMNEYPPL